MGDTLGPFNLILLALPGVAIKIAVRSLYGRRSFAAADPVKILLSVASNVMLVLALLGGVVGLVGFWWMLIPVGIIFGVVALMAIDRFRHGEHRALVWTLAAAAQRGVPLAEAARAYADETQDDTGARALALARGLEQGSSLWVAARAARLRLSTPLRLAIRLGEALGELGPAMRQQLADQSDADNTLRNLVARFFYLGTVLGLGLLILTYVMLRIVPVFQRMFQDFELELPPMTQALIRMSNVASTFVALLLIPVALLAVVFAIGGLMYFVGLAPRDLPLVRSLFKRYDGAIVLRGLALTVRRGVSLVEGLKLIAATYPLRSVAHRLDRAGARVAAGIDWRQSLLSEGLIARADAAVLAAAERAGNLPWALEEMAESALRRQGYRVQIALQCLFPLAVVVLGMCVGFFVVALFLPLISLVQGLS
ncbi:MAG: type II secretion system F family protein [Pirellulaceae bacterium]